VTELETCRRSTESVGGGNAYQNPPALYCEGHTLGEPPSSELHANLTLSAATGGRTGQPVAAAHLDHLPFAEVWLVDFEFGSEPGGNPEPVCLVAWELKSGRKIRLWRDQFGASPPYPTDPNVLFVAYYASAEIGCHLALGWPVPQRVLDLFIEFRNHTNGIPTVSGAGLLGALAHHGLDGIGTVEKDEMRELA